MFWGTLVLKQLVLLSIVGGVLRPPLEIPDPSAPDVCRAAPLPSQPPVTDQGTAVQTVGRADRYQAPNAHPLRRLALLSGPVGSPILPSF